MKKKKKKDIDKESPTDDLVNSVVKRIDTDVFVKSVIRGIDKLLSPD